MEFEKFIPVEGVGFIPVSKKGQTFLIAGNTSPRVGQVVVYQTDNADKRERARYRVRRGKWVVGPKFEDTLDFDRVYASPEEVAEARKAHIRAIQAEKKARAARKEARESLKNAEEDLPREETEEDVNDGDHVEDAALVQAKQEEPVIEDEDAVQELLEGLQDLGGIGSF